MNNMYIATIRQKLAEIEILLSYMELADTVKIPNKPLGIPRCYQCNQPIDTLCCMTACPNKYTVT